MMQHPHLFLRIVSAAALGLVCFALHAQDLPRKAFHGFRPAPCESGGVVVGSVVDGGTAKAAGLVVGDTVLMANNMAIDIRSASAVLGGMKVSEKVSYTVKRGERIRVLRAVMLARPPESADGLVYTYGAVPYGGGLLRSIATRAAGSTGKRSAVLFIQGYTCNSVCDIALEHPYRRITDELARQGYVSLRVEKPGLGESQGGTPCEDIDLHQEVEAFRAALHALKQLPDVDTARVFIFGHSLGGITGPLITATERVKGIAVYGTSHLPWFEYFFQMLRTQGSNIGTDPLELEKKMRRYHSLLYALMVERRTPQEVVAQDTSFAALLRTDFQWDGGRHLLGRDVSMYWDLNSVDLTAAWHATDAHVLSMFGTADIEVMTNDGPKQIITIVNHGHPGNGTYREFDGTNHSFARVCSMEAEYKVSGTADYWPLLRDKYDPRIVLSFIEWTVGF